MTIRYKNAVCRGSWALGSACGKCERCAETKPVDAQVQAPDEYYAKVFSQADIDVATFAERTRADRLEAVLKDMASRANAVLAQTERRP